MKIDVNPVKNKMDSLFTEIRLKFPIHGINNIIVKRQQFVEQLKIFGKLKMGKNLNINFEGEGINV